MKRTLYIQEPHASPALAEACLSLTPKISHYSTGELLLDVASPSHLLGGEKKILSRLESIGEHFHIERTVVADRPEWVKPLALGTEARIVIPPGESQSKLFSLKIERIPLLGEPLVNEGEWKERHRLVAFMRRVGLDHIHDFARLSPLSINRRFGKMGILLHQWTWGKRELPIPVYTPEEPLHETLDASEITCVEALLLGLGPIIQRFEQRLLGRNELTAKLTFRFVLETGECLVKDLILSEPAIHSPAVVRVLDPFLRSLSWQAPLHTVDLTITDTVPRTPTQLSLLDSLENRAHDIHHFIHRLKSQGFQAGHPVLCDSHLPENGWRLVWPFEKSGCHSPFRDRPLFIFSNPKPITAPTAYPLLPSERIETQWWEDSPQNRAYFITRTPLGERLWVFINLNTNTWFWHGIF